ncbi:50S ribosomal protein L33 [Mycoplasmopsis synoviae]|uniref:Large ribosomal subunit protein bL33 n=1 Tax=Mycoplasmopsis synoviae TaxID=2109 RepID=A0AAQ2TCE6_MYCSY|nr:50S ribosomal protein L33 [Mycoplasmopsis synoviae]AWL84148.1 50S ribosomal protein L33 [Mycoplasmopsis synoviae]QGL45006.1 50S ribosomal protein L33 [Mycoplasmopsis synoviae]QLE13869.1 50S ribosomal protein L33 [Mycoplasmopsis synoviae]QXV99180.1 50S ribosomal protein L33 [Mycoplasmopsis synoviae]UBM43351.1 50S ribosomal protein L33 [Mycoplasmopsis synoviae]
MKNDKKIFLACSECRVKNYTTNKTLNVEKRVAINKYCPKCKKHNLHKEEL